MNDHKFNRSFFGLLIIIALFGCGGGGENKGTTTPTVDTPPAVSALAREIINYKQAVQQLTVTNEDYHQAMFEFSQKNFSDGTTEQANQSFEHFFAKEEALLDALTAYHSIVSGSARPLVSTQIKVFKITGECEASTTNGDVLTEVANASPGLIGGVNIGTVISTANTIETARDKIELLKTKQANGDIDDIDYMNAMNELQKQVLKDGMKTTIGGYVGAGTGLVVGMVASAAGLTVAPVVMIGAAASYIAGTTFNMLFVNNKTQEVTTARASAESAQFALPECSEGTLVVSTDVIDENDDSEPSPLIIENFATPDTGNISPFDSEVNITLPPVKPIDQVSPDNDTIDIEKTVDIPASATSCDDIQTIHINPVTSLDDKTATFNIRTQPQVSACLFTLSGSEVKDGYHTPISVVARTQNGGVYSHTINGPQQGIMNTSISVTTDNGASTSLTHNFDFGLTPLISITSESVVKVELGNTLTLSEMNVAAQYDDGSEKLLFDTDLTWELISGCGDIDGNVYSAPESDVCNATVKLNYVDDFEQVVSSTFVIDVVPVFGITLIELDTNVPTNQNIKMMFNAYVGRDDSTVTISATGDNGYIAEENEALPWPGSNFFTHNVWRPDYLETPDIWIHGDHITITVSITAPKTATEDAIDISEQFEADWIAGEESPHKGNYSGSISGDDTGALSFTVGVAGYIQGTVYSNVDEQSYVVDGYVDYTNGSVSLGTSGISGWGSGNIVNGKVTNGTWASRDGAYSDSGTWTVTKQ